MACAIGPLAEAQTVVELYQRALRRLRDELVADMGCFEAAGSLMGRDPEHVESWMDEGFKYVHTAMVLVDVMVDARAAEDAE